MWIIIRFDRAHDSQSNESVISTDVELLNFINSTLDTNKKARMVMIPKSSDKINKKMFPILTSEKFDFYAQWFD